MTELARQNPGLGGDGRSVKLRIPAKPEYITLVRLALSGLARLRPLDDETLGDLKLAVTEACSNSVRHGYGNGREGTVRSRTSSFRTGSSSRSRTTVPASIRTSPIGKGEDLSEGGLGIAIIKSVADEFEAGERPEGGGSRLRFVKFLGN